jgi:glycosyltransferase involved in cell wall biosynthesis
MMHLFINSLAASAGGGLTYIRNVLPQLARQPGLRVTITTGRSLRAELSSFDNVDFLELEGSAVRRFWYEQRELPRVIANSGAQVLLSTGNLALRSSPVPQILLSRNSIYTSADFYKDLRSRHEYRAWLDTHLRGWLARKSVEWADVTVAPSQAFAGELERWTGRHVSTIHHGFDKSAFTADNSPLDPKVVEKLDLAQGSLKLLFVSHYNYYRNFETAFRALSHLRKSQPGRPIKLLLTCKLASGENPGAYSVEAAARLIDQLGIGDMVVQLGSIPYRQLHQLYRQADIYISSAYTETFAHPLVEAMSSGLPVVASDLPVHREICGDAALYFPRFGPRELADRVLEIDSSTPLAERLSGNGLARANTFSWKRHADELLLLAQSLVANRD